MARISGVDLPRDKRIEIGLTYVYGIGRATSNRLLKEAGVNPDTRVRDLTDEEVGKIRDAIDADSILIEGDLRREIAINIKRLQEIGCYILPHQLQKPVFSNSRNHVLFFLFRFWFRYFQCFLPYLHCEHG